ncbi:MAG: peptidase [Betaproteobacteria bacterium RIFCSPLOWO2_02_64_14]|nr:MAG: peptidase [Betaproteobacteria bacterium RIFCSPLOWO2_02_64_14]
MTYCVAAVLDVGMVFASDSRTSAGVDHVSSFRKMRIFAAEGERVIIILSSGNLSITQNVVNILDHQSRNPDAKKTVMNVASMIEVAERVGETLREVKRRDGPYLEQSNVDASATLLVGGQIRGERQRLFHIYNEGNFIEATRDTPYFQIGESKYGKPVIDRVIKCNTEILDATKCILVSFDSTMRSNISVGLPIDLLVYVRDSFRIGMQRRVEEDDPYFTMIHQQWGNGLRKVFAGIPNPDWTVGA